jgi:hypothetical protein
LQNWFYCKLFFDIFCTGLGNRFARYLDDKGFTIFAGCLNKNSAGAKSLITECSSRLQVVEVNTTKEDSIATAFQFVKNHLPIKGQREKCHIAKINRHILYKF